MSSENNSKKYFRVTQGFNIAQMEALSEAEIFKAVKGQRSRFISTYYYNKEHFDKFTQTKSVAGITDVKTDKIWFDLDSDDGGEQARLDSIELVHRLLKCFPIEAIDVYYSGNKGIHIILKHDKELTRSEVEAITQKFSSGLTSFDSSLYDQNQILRVPNTKHEKSGLYKIQITPEELETLSIDKIREIARNNRAPTYSTDIVKISDDLLVKNEKKELVVKVDMLPPQQGDPLRIKEIDFSSKPHGWRDYKWAIAQGCFEIGTRNHSMMVIASTCRALKYGKEHTEAICNAADKLHCSITGDSPIEEYSLEKEVLSVVFSPTWNGGQYSIENDLNLKEYCEKYGFKQEKENHVDVINLQNIHATFKDYVKNIDKNTIVTGIEELDKAVPITVGMNFGIIGSASSGKTALALEILKNTSLNGVVSVIASLDMHRTRLYEKILYKVSHDVYKKTLSRNELYQKFQDDQDTRLSDEVKVQFGNVYFYDRSRPTVDDLRKFILNVEATTGQKVKLLMIDYFERIGTDVSDATAASLKVANELQDLLNDLNLAIITLVQPNKFSLSGGPDTPILNYTAIKGSSFLYQSFRSIISIWRPFFTPKTRDLDQFLEMAILKNDLGELDTFKFNWDGKTGSISGMSEEDETRFQSYIAEKKAILSPPGGEEQQFRRHNGF